MAHKNAVIAVQLTVSLKGHIYGAKFRTDFKMERLGFSVKPNPLGLYDYLGKCFDHAFAVLLRGHCPFDRIERFIEIQNYVVYVLYSDGHTD